METQTQSNSRILRRKQVEMEKYLPSTESVSGLHI